ncbi:MAG: NRDE family protein [Chitinophagales bacterium]|nr:NRDE family protein [Chitinophagales bacterium]MDW8427115.1 NRDE family protein [Chitinophagales bacterium]
MCTVSYLPLTGGFQLVSNRDERASRGIAYIPRSLGYSGDVALFAMDRQAGGTWLAFSLRGRVACLLNGAFQKHKSMPPYRRSRGLVLLDWFGFPSAQTFHDEYDFTGIEPFTLILIDLQRRLWELRWTGTQKFLHEVNANQVQQWSSVTLYDADTAERKKQWLLNHLPNDRQLSVFELAELHKHFLYERWVEKEQRVPEVHTLSISVVQLQGQQVEWYYSNCWIRPDFKRHFVIPLLDSVASQSA